MYGNRMSVKPGRESFKGQCCVCEIKDIILRCEVVDVDMDGGS